VPNIFPACYFVSA